MLTFPARLRLKPGRAGRALALGLGVAAAFVGGARGASDYFENEGRIMPLIGRLTCYPGRPLVDGEERPCLPKPAPPSAPAATRSVNALNRIHGLLVHKDEASA